MPQKPGAVKPPKPARRIGVETQEHELLARHHRGERVATDELVRRFTPLAVSLARRYSNSSEPFDDLRQVASLGLLKALQRFDPALGSVFSAFAVPTILGELRRYFRDSGWSVHVPRRTQELALKVRDAQQHLATEHHRAATVEQLARHLQIDTEQVIAALQSSQAYNALSMDAARPSDAGEVTTYAESIGREDPHYALAESRSTLAAVIGRLPVREQDILRMRFSEELTQTEIGARVGISQMQVSRVLRRALDRLRNLVGEPPPARPQSPHGGPVSPAAGKGSAGRTRTAA